MSVTPSRTYVARKEQMAQKQVLQFSEHKTILPVQSNSFCTV
uniref:Uncharacterized protein n=1 Tax=Salmonella sp. 14 TaxID=1179812 RepID=I3W349_9ENTR|nr:hypothetical protein [Salmonella sp. 14]